MRQRDLCIATRWTGNTLMLVPRCRPLTQVVSKQISLSRDLAHVMAMGTVMERMMRPSEPCRAGHFGTSSRKTLI